MVRHILATWLQQLSPTAKPEMDTASGNYSPPTTPEIEKDKHEKHNTMGAQNGISRPSHPNGKPSVSSHSRIGALAQQIATETGKVEAYFEKRGWPMPSFEVDSPDDFPKLPEDVSRCRREVIEATQELHDLMVGPRESVRWMAWDFMSTQCLQLINSYGIPKLVPVDGSITLPELQAKTTLDAINLARIIRYAITNHIFQEPSPGVIAHTAASRLLLEDDALQAWVGFNTEDIYPSSARVVDALTRHPEAMSLTRTGFNFAHDTVDKEPMFVTFGRDPARAKRMGQAMSSLTGGEGYEISYLVEGCDLSEADARGGTFVDVGGSHGFVCVDLALKHRNLRFVVQDLPQTVESAPSPLSADAQVARRISFQAHDFFTEQTVQGADVYFFRWIMHNYSTPYAVQILRSLVPALKPGARVIVNDHCLREPGAEEPWDERIVRGMDLVMMTLLNAQERDEEAFRRLFEMADEGFVFKGVTRPMGCRMSIIEAVWKPHEVDGPSSNLRTESE
ncbi:Uu.00g114810.m01.CDS01 [Anthostomella pinea]|uniref:Uu.00g114810.m01.CDS01 n=1 Tax=Anthostomella pinea TaxID=933095 RepID=A0AAI8VAJ4_9PEZI|nr:Uu.00g114810.m01.CDS01 [Anthostomella pinea]